MDSPQSSDVFLDLTNQSCTQAMDVNTYDLLINNTKASLNRNVKALSKTDVFEYFSTLLEDCRICITQTLHLLTEALMESNIGTQKLESYLEDAITILHLLSSFIKNTVESFAMSCTTMKTFPITTGQIIVDIFIHCKNSESVYGEHLINVQQKLKDLFRTCHELQLTYLMVLEKHFVFDLSEKEELDILVKVLNINLHIGEVVQALDVKTMAEQWKAYTVICDKYSTHLLDTCVYQDCTMLLCTLIINNLKSSLEVEHDDKLVLRSMKVTNFTIKILSKMLTIFKNTQVKPYQYIIELLINIYLYNPAYLENIAQKSPEFINVVSVNVLNPADLLLKELLDDETFNKVILNYNYNNIRQTDELFGYIFLVVTLIKSALQKSNKNTVPKTKIISCIFEVLPDSYVWMNMGMKFEVDSRHNMKSVGLYEYLLINVIRLTLTMSCEDYCALEKTMCEAMLGVDSIQALFASNLWILLNRVTNNKHLLTSQLVSLCQIYQKLEKLPLFSRSPQKVYLSYTISSLFEIVDVEDRIKIYKHFNPLISAKNISLWSVLRINKLPIEFQRTIEEDVIDKFKMEFQKFTSGFQYKETFDVVNTMKLAASCSCQVLENIEDILLEAWLRACPNSLKFLSEEISINVLWFLDYVEALVSLTCAMQYTVYGRSSYIIKILHVISGLVKLRNKELQLLLINLLCKLAINQINDENRTEAARITNETFKVLILDSDAFIRNTFFKMVRSKENEVLYQIVSSIVCGNQLLLHVWQQFTNDNDTFFKIKLKEHLTLLNNFKYRHKCVEYKEVSAVSEKKQSSCSSNFDFADIDTLFDNNESDAESAAKKVMVGKKDNIKEPVIKTAVVSDNSDDCKEPVSKKMKLDTTEVETILDRLEQDTTLLCDIRENVFNYKHKKRIRLLYERLVSIVSND